MRSIWGFSDDYAWGLATTNPCTVKTLESATFRKCKTSIIKKNLKAIRAIGADVSFVKDAECIVTGASSQINTDFYVDNHAFINDDVIGSFPEQEDNLKIIETAYRQLKTKGIFILSVMNMELTDTLVLDSNKGNLQNNPDIIRKLPPSHIMQSSGDIFNPKFLAIDIPTGLVYRKEQFCDDDGLAAEYVIRDKRYSRDEKISLLEKQGFEVAEARYVRAGHFDEPLKNIDKHAKEICIVARKR